MDADHGDLMGVIVRPLGLDGGLLVPAFIITIAAVAAFALIRRRGRRGIWAALPAALAFSAMAAAASRQGG